MAQSFSFIDKVKLLRLKKIYENRKKIGTIPDKVMKDPKLALAIDKSLFLQYSLQERFNILCNYPLYGVKLDNFGNMYTLYMLADFMNSGYDLTKIVSDPKFLIGKHYYDTFFNLLNDKAKVEFINIFNIDNEFLTTQVKKNPELLVFIPLNDELIKILLDEDIKYITYMPDSIKKNIILKNEYILKTYPDYISFFTDEELVSKITSECPWLINYCNDDIIKFILSYDICNIKKLNDERILNLYQTNPEYLYEYAEIPKAIQSLMDYTEECLSNLGLKNEMFDKLCAFRLNMDNCFWTIIDILPIKFRNSNHSYLNNEINNIMKNTINNVMKKIQANFNNDQKQIFDFIIKSGFIKNSGITDMVDNENNSVSNELYFRNAIFNKSIFTIIDENGMNYIVDSDINSLFVLPREKLIDVFEKRFGTEKKNLYIDELSFYSKFPSYEDHTDICFKSATLLFERDIINKCNPDLIKKYFSKVINNEDAADIFYQIIESAYGYRALKLLQSREALSVENIVSVEVFGLINDFGEPFVHDCLTYNFNNYSDFLQLTRDSKRKQSFMYYYKLISGIYGSGALAMQKAMTDFSYVEELLNNIENVKLEDEEQKNLLNVLISDRNAFGIKNLEDLKNFKSIANECLSDCIKKNVNNSYIDELKEEVFLNLFGIRYITSLYRDGKYTSEYTSDSFQRIDSLYSLFKKENILLDPAEKQIFNIFRFLSEEKSFEKINEFLSSFKNTDRNYYSIIKFLDRIKIAEIEKLNSKMTSINDLKKLYMLEQNLPENEKTVLYKKEEDGLEVITLNGCKFNLLEHEINANAYDFKIGGLKDFLTYENLNANAAVCCRIVSSEIDNGQSLSKGSLLYGNISDPIGNSTGFGLDASTEHGRKTPIASASVGMPISEIEKAKGPNNELSFYRYNRNHNDINNENHGGRKIPTAYVGIPTNPEERKLLIEYGIPVIYYEASKYKHKNNDLTIKSDELIDEKTR